MYNTTEKAVSVYEKELYDFFEEFLPSMAEAVKKGNIENLMTKDIGEHIHGLLAMEKVLGLSETEKESKYDIAAEKIAKRFGLSERHIKEALSQLLSKVES